MQQQIDLYHGTSTLFLDSILANGLGGVNPVAEWNLREMCREVYELSAKHLKDTDLFKNRSYSFGRMAAQSTGKLNFQHGDTYLSASSKTAAEYAIRKRYGSELLTYTIDFLQALMQAEVPEAKHGLYKKYRHIYKLIEACPSPILVQVSGVIEGELVSEHGTSAAENFAAACDFTNDARGEMYLRQCNFRLVQTIVASRLKVWLINVRNWDQLAPDYNLYEIGLPMEDISGPVNGQ